MKCGNFDFQVFQFTPTITGTQQSVSMDCLAFTVLSVQATTLPKLDRQVLTVGGKKKKKETFIFIWVPPKFLIVLSIRDFGQASLSSELINCSLSIIQHWNAIAQRGK